jgi:hypothetical protein
MVSVMEKVKRERNGVAMGREKPLERRAELDRKEGAQKMELNGRMDNDLGWNVGYVWRLTVLKRIIRQR